MRVGAGWVSTLLQRLVVALWLDDTAGAGRGRGAGQLRPAAHRADRGARPRGLVAHGRTGINVWVPVVDEMGAVAALRDAGYAVAPGAYRTRCDPAGVAGWPVG